MIFFSFPKMANFCQVSLFLILLVTAFCFCSSSSVASSDYLQSECLYVPASSFMSSLKTTMDAIRQVTPVISQFARLLGDFRLSNAVSDCLDLLDISADELDWSLSASQNPNGKAKSPLFLITAESLGIGIVDD